LSVTVIKNGKPLDGSDKSVETGNLELVVRVAAQAKALTPVETGKLRGSITWKVPGQEGGYEEGPKLMVEPKKDSGLVGSATEYAAYVEFGTRNQDAQPYLQPAVLIETLGPRGQNILKQATIKEMTKALTKGRKVISKK
jgi:HK97 gp10 family phage protein